MYHAVCPLIGLKVRVTVADEVKSVGPAVYVCNHQSNYDIFTVTGAVQPGVVAVGKKSLLWLPFFGLIFWLSGNVLIDRSNRSRAIGTIGQVVERIRIAAPPSGCSRRTRSRGAACCRSRRAPSTAVQAEVPVVPIVCSSYFGQIDLNRWDNGEVLLR